MKRTILNILQRSLDLICNDSYKFLTNNIDIFSTIIKFITISIFIYKFIRGLSFDIGLLSLITSFIISFAIYNFVLDKFSYSENKYIGFIQRFLFYNFIFIISISSLIYVFNLLGLFPTVYCSDSDINKNKEIKEKELVVITTKTDQHGNSNYNLQLDKEFIDNGLKNINTVAIKTAEKIGSNMGVGTAAGAAAAATIKSTVGMPLSTRLLTVGATTAVTAAATKAGMEIGSEIVRNTDLTELIKNSPHADPQHDRIPSPDSNFINSPLENEIVSPLQELLLWSFILDILILILVIGILLIIFNRYITKYNLNFINSIVNKYMPIKIRNRYKITETGIDYNNKLVLIIFIINIILLFFVIFFKLIISSTLLVDIDSFISVHNYLHDKESSMILIISSAYKHNLININKKIRKKYLI